MIEQVAPGLLRISLPPFEVVNAVTHAHPDHQGVSHAVCEEFGIPLWRGEADRNRPLRDGARLSEFVARLRGE